MLLSTLRQSLRGTLDTCLQHDSKLLLSDIFYRRRQALQPAARAARSVQLARTAGAKALTPCCRAPVKDTQQTPVKTLWSALGRLLKITMSRNRRLSLSERKALHCKVVETCLLFSICLISTRKKYLGGWRAEIGNSILQLHP